MKDVYKRQDLYVAAYPLRERALEAVPHRYGKGYRTEYRQHHEEERADGVYHEGGVYIIFMIIGIIGYFTIPPVAGWIIQAGGMGGYGRNVNQMAGRAGSMAGSVAPFVLGRLIMLSSTSSPVALNVFDTKKSKHRIAI